MTTADRFREDFLTEIEDLRQRLEESQETLRAIGSGEVDAFVVSGPEGEQVFTLTGAEYPYRVLVETMNEGAATLAADGSILYCNNRLSAMLQVPLERLIGTQLSSYVTPADLPLFEARLGKCTEECDKDEITMITGAGNAVSVMISCCAAEISGNREIGMVITDLTQQKRNEETMAAEKLARSIIEQAGEAIIVCDEGGRIIRASRLAHELCGENLLLKPFNELFPLRIPETESQFSVLAPLNDARLESVEVEFKRSDDQIYHLILNAAPLKCVQNRISGCVVSLTDITERKKAEDALRQSEDRLQAANEELQAQSEELQSQSEEIQAQSEELQAQNHELTRLWEESKRAEEILRASERDYAAMFESAIVGKAQADPATGRFTRVNRTLTEITGYSAEELCRMTFVDITHPDDRQRDLQGFEPVRSGTAGSWQIEKRYTRKDGSIIWVEVAGNLLRDGNGRPLRTSAVIQDITERKQAEEVLRNLNEILEKQVAIRTAELSANIEKLQVETAERIQAVEALRKNEQMLILQSRQAAMGEMIGNIAHQWRQPLNTLALTVQQLPLFHDLGELTRESLNKSVLQSMGLIKHMSSTIDDFRNFFSPGKEKIEFKATGSVANTLSLVEDSFNKQNIDIQVIAKKDPTIYGFQNEYAQVLLNILNNARDVLTERETADPRVTITICSEGERSVVAIADNAGGIPADILDKIFEPYFTTKGPQAGTGVGLFMSKTIIEKNMGGRLTARNSADGAEFRIEV